MFAAANKRNVSLYETGNLTESALEKSRTRWVIGLFLSAIFGCLAALIGLSVSVLSLFDILDDSSRLGHAGTWLVAAFFPLMALASHSLDKADELGKAIRLEYCRRHGLQDEC